MIANPILRRRTPEIHHVSIVSKCQYTRVSDILGEKSGRPVTSTLFMEPSCRCISSQPMHKDDTMPGETKPEDRYIYGKTHSTIAAVGTAGSCRTLTPSCVAEVGIGVEVESLTSLPMHCTVPPASYMTSGLSTGLSRPLSMPSHLRISNIYYIDCSQ
jgi:hypothetical protein